MKPRDPDPSEQPLKDHEYDGIQELNHPAPFWWQAIFYLSIVWGIGYLAHYQLGEGTSIDEEYARDRVAVENEALRQKAQRPPVDPNRLIAMVKEPAALTAGKAVFSSKCVSCHGPEGGGGIGPNLTDRAWLHGDGKPVAIYQTVEKGVLEKGMPAWGPMLSPQELESVVAYVGSLRGTHPANPKAPQGTEVAD